MNKYGIGKHLGKRYATFAIIDRSKRIIIAYLQN